VKTMTKTMTIGEYAEGVWQREREQQSRVTPLDMTPEERKATAVPIERPGRGAPALFDLRFTNDEGVVVEGRAWNALVQQYGVVSFWLDRDGEWELLSVRIEWFARDGGYCISPKGHNIVQQALNNERTRRQRSQRT